MPESMTGSEVRVTVSARYFAGASAAAGVEAEEIALPAQARLADLTAAMTARHPALAPVLQVASLLLGGVATTDPETRLTSGQQVDVLPPFAGG